MQGWIKLHRKILEDDMWLEEPFDKSRAWIDLLLNANFEKKSFWVRQVEVVVDRGQLAWSELTLAKRWRWSREKVRRYLKWLETRQQIRQHKTYITSLITIIKYEEYQKQDSRRDNKRDSRRDTTKELKNDKNVKNKENTNTRLASKEAENRIHTSGPTSIGDIIKKRT